MAAPPARPASPTERRTPKAVGLRLRRLREAVGYPEGRQRAFADEIEIRYGTWNAWEKGENAFPLGAAYKLKDLFGAPLDWVYDGDSRNLPFELAIKLGEVFDPDSA